MQAKRIIFSTFMLTEICEAGDDGASPWPVNQESPSGEQSYFRPVARELKYGKRTGTYSWNLFPVVVDGKGALWDEACLYILDEIKNPINQPPPMPAWAQVAADLAEFKTWIDDYCVDFKSFPVRPDERPTYRFRADRITRVNAGELKRSSAGRQMSRVIAFYKWLEGSRIITPEYAMWNEEDTYIPFTDGKGLERKKKVTTTDVSIKRGPAQRDPYLGQIDDGGKLRPLPRTEQDALLNALRALGNTEMTLIHVFALATGARIQTILTLRVRHVRVELEDDVALVHLAAGPGTGIDTKFGKTGTLLVPRVLYESLRTYSYSKRAAARRAKSGCDTEDQHLFLSHLGKILYRSRADRAEFDESFNIHHEKVGQGVRQYIREFIIPKIEEMTGQSIDYMFHDLRATAGMNWADNLNSLIQKGEITWTEAISFISTRMWHERAETTELYLNFRKNLKMVQAVQEKFEDHLDTITQDAMRNIND
jgi:hypothetical protein